MKAREQSSTRAKSPAPASGTRAKRNEVRSAVAPSPATGKQPSVSTRRPSTREAQPADASRASANHVGGTPPKAEKATTRRAPRKNEVATPAVKAPSRRGKAAVVDPQGDQPATKATKGRADAQTGAPASNRIAGTLRAKLPPRKIFVAMAGNIGAGKTTAAKMLSQTFGFELFDEPVIDNRFLREYYADMTRWSFTLQLEFLLRRVEHHELIHTVKKSCVQDRTLYEDPEIFAKYLHGLGHLTNAELDLYHEYFGRLARGIARPDKVICFDVPDVDVLMSRIRTRGRQEEKGIKQQFLRGLNGYYTSLPQVLQGKYGIDCLTIDVSKDDIRRGLGKERFLDEVTSFLAR